MKPEGQLRHAPHDPQHGAAAPVHARRAADGAGAGRRDDHEGRTATSATCTPASRRSARRRPDQQAVTLTDRIDYLCPPVQQPLLLRWRWKSCCGIEIPPSAQWMRVMLTELTRINSHLVWLGTHALDIGAMTVFLYCFREREDILRIFEMFSGQRMMTSYFRIGGLALEPPRGWQQAVGKFIDAFPSQGGRVRRPADEQPDLAAAAPRAWATLRSTTCSTRASPGPMIRAAGLAWDIRKRRAVLELREVRFRSSGAHRKRRVRALPGAHGGNAAERADREAGAGRHAGGRRGRPTRRTWCCRTAKR